MDEFFSGDNMDEWLMCFFCRVFVCKIRKIMKYLFQSKRIQNFITRINAIRSSNLSIFMDGKFSYLYDSLRFVANKCYRFVDSGKYYIVCD